MVEACLKVEGVSKIIKKQTLIEDISLQVPKGNVLALCGGNGAGKSTLLRIIAGIYRPTCGQVSINGLQWAKDRKVYAAQIGFMPDDYQFQHGLTARETLTFWAAMRKIPEPEVTVDELLELVDLADKDKTMVTTFSKGMRQRLLFAQSLLAKPPLLIMDEPTNGLDPFWMNEFVSHIRRVKEEGHTVIFSTHQLEIAEQVADYIVFMNSGHAVGEGSTSEICERYGSLFSAFNYSLGLTKM